MSSFYLDMQQILWDIVLENNIKRFKEQLNTLGLSFDCDRELKTSDSKYYKWTQWIFLKLYNSFFDTKKNKACDINELKVPKDVELLLLKLTGIPSQVF